MTRSTLCVLTAIASVVVLPTKATASPAATSPSIKDVVTSTRCDGDSGGAKHGNGANASDGGYLNNCNDGSSRNGNRTTDVAGLPCAGCVGQADDKNPPGQYRDGSDHNKGYECDGNSGISRKNPAHTACRTSPPPPPPPPPILIPPLAPPPAPHPACIGSACTPAIVTTTTTTTTKTTTSRRQPPEVLGARVTPRLRVASEPIATLHPAATRVLGVKLARTGISAALLLLVGLALLATGICVMRFGSKTRRS